LKYFFNSEAKKFFDNNYLEQTFIMKGDPRDLIPHSSRCSEIAWKEGMDPTKKKVKKKSGKKNK
jgi:hypothetical protein